MWQEITLWVLLTLCHSITFTYRLRDYAVQCFNEDIEKDSRFQLNVVGNSSDFNVNVYTAEGSLVDLTDPEQFDKSYAGFAKITGLHYICLTNMGSHTVQLRVTLKNGLSTDQRNDDKSMLVYKTESVNQAAKLIDRNFKFYRERLKTRDERHQYRISYLTATLVLVVVTVCIVSYLQMRNFKNFLSKEKYI